MSERVFEDFREFFSLTRPMNDTQKDIIMKCLAEKEAENLIKSRKNEGWEDLIIQNEIDFLIDQVKAEFNEDLIYLRIQVLSGHLRKVKKAFWEYVNDIFSGFPIRYKHIIFEGLSIRDCNDDWILLIPTRRSANEQKKGFDS